MDPQRIGTRESILVLTRAADRLLTLKAGDVVRGRVVDVLPGGMVNLRIMGNLFQARSTLPLSPDAGVLFRVVGQKVEKDAPEIHLQFLEVIPDEGSPRLFQDSPSRFLRILAQEMAGNLPLAKEIPQDFGALVERLLKSLPDDSTAIPRATREQLLALLQTSLRNTGESIQNRLNTLLTAPYSEEIPEIAEMIRVRDRLFADVEKILQVSVKALLENTGVTLEAKLKALARALTMDAELPSQDSLPGLAKGRSPGSEQLETDLKARLLQLRQMLISREEEIFENSMPTHTAKRRDVGNGKPAAGQLLHTVDGLLRDIETFQLLSKLTNSFYTFLPVLWEGLKEAEIAFKKSRSGPEGKSYYCLLHLDFDRLGKLTIVAMMQGRDFFISFKTSRDKMREVLSKNVRELEQVFDAQGFTLKGVSFLREEESQLALFERLESFENIVNFKI